MNRIWRSGLLLTGLTLMAPVVPALAAPGPSARAVQGEAQKPLEKAPLTIIDRHGAHHDFTVEIARTEKEKEAGESTRQTIPDDMGMLFLFNPPEAAAMWMRNTPASLDIVFIGADGHIQAIAERTVPYSERRLTGQGDSAAVLEVAAGTMEKNNIVVGDLVSSKALTAAH